MRRSSLSASLLLAALVLFSGVEGQEQGVVRLAGSGTTNPSKCYWLIMEKMMERMKIPSWMTYRAVGSSTGQDEFMGLSPEFAAQNDFGSGDIPISTDDYNTLTNEGVKFVQLPVVLGAISLFHSIPNMPSGTQGLNLTSCLIAQIFREQIVHWDDEQIKAINPNLNVPEKYPILVARRRHGSSSTASVTKYLNDTCPEEWSDELTGKEIKWPENFLICEGSGGMTSCIRDNPGTIGYIDAGHGHSERLVEIELKNKDGKFLSSKTARENGGIGAAAGEIPTSPDADFGHVILLNQPGPYTWPIVAMTYIYVRKNLFEHLPSPASQGLLVAFLKSLYREEYISMCEERFGLIPVPENARNVSFAGIGMLVTNDTAPEFTFEVETQKVIGQGEYVISSKRRSGADVARSAMHTDIDSLLEDLDYWQTRAASLESSMSALEAQMETIQMQVDTLAVTVNNEIKNLDHDHDHDSGNSHSNPANSGSGSHELNGADRFEQRFGVDEESQLEAALVMSAFSISLWVIFLVGWFIRSFCCQQARYGTPTTVLKSSDDAVAVANHSPGTRTNGGGQMP